MAQTKTERVQEKRDRKRRRRRILWSAVAIVLLLGIGGAGYRAWSLRNAPMAGSAATDFTLPDQDGGTVRLADFRGKQEIALFFYMFAG